MFRVVNPETITVTVRVEPPGQPANQFSLTLRYLGVSERRDLLSKARENGTDVEADEQLISGLVTGWDGLEREDGSILEFSTEHLHNLLNIPYMRSAIVRVVVEELLLGGGAEKNFGALPASGRGAPH